MRVVIELSDEEYAEFIKLKGSKTWKEVLMTGLQSLSQESPTQPSGFESVTCPYCGHEWIAKRSSSRILCPNCYQSHDREIAKIMRSRKAPIRERVKKAVEAGLLSGIRERELLETFRGTDRQHAEEELRRLIEEGIVVRLPDGRLFSAKLLNSLQEGTGWEP